MLFSRSHLGLAQLIDLKITIFSRTSDLLYVSAASISLHCYLFMLDCKLPFAYACWLWRTGSFHGAAQRVTLDMRRLILLVSRLECNVSFGFCTCRSVAAVSKQCGTCVPAIKVLFYFIFRNSLSRYRLCGC